jgi:mRNA-degrading endonuclease RelE of RelBE toxin-antitoxin system
LKYALRVSNTFERQLRRLGRRDRERVWKAVHEIEASPYSYKPLGGQLAGTNSARVGNLRIVYAVDEPAKRVVLLYVGPRERVYEH